MTSISLREALSGWDDRDLRNLWFLLERKDEVASLDQVERSFKWLYHSKVRAEAERSSRSAWTLMRTMFSNESSDEVTREELRATPRYDELIVEATRHLKVYEGDSTLDDCEVFLSHAIILAALQNMTPRQRMKFFQEPIAFDTLASRAGLDSDSFRGPMATIAALGAAQLSGFGIYAASTTALGFLTQAIGVTLPFAAYTGLTSTIAYVIGPMGWLTASVWGVWKLTEPKWKTITPALLYIVSCNARRRETCAK